MWISSTKQNYPICGIPQRYTIITIKLLPYKTRMVKRNQKKEFMPKSTEMREQQITKKRDETENESEQMATKVESTLKLKLQWNQIQQAPNVLECTKMNLIDITMANMVIGFLCNLHCNIEFSNLKFHRCN